MVDLTRAYDKAYRESRLVTIVLAKQTKLNLSSANCCRAAASRMDERHIWSMIAMTTERMKRKMILMPMI